MINRDRLIQARRRLDISDDEMARVLGVSPYTIRNWENGSRSVSPMAVRMLDVLDMLRVCAPDVHRALIDQSIDP